MSDFATRSLMSYKDFKDKYGTFDVVVNPKNGNMFWSVPSMDKFYGFFGPKTKEAIAGCATQADFDALVDRVQFGECTNDGGQTWVWGCWLPASNNVLFSSH